MRTLHVLSILALVVVTGARALACPESLLVAARVEAPPLAANPAVSPRLIESVQGRTREILIGLSAEEFTVLKIITGKTPDGLDTERLSVERYATRPQWLEPIDLSDTEQLRLSLQAGLTIHLQLIDERVDFALRQYGARRTWPASFHAKLKAIARAYRLHSTYISVKRDGVLVGTLRLVRSTLNPLNLDLLPGGGVNFSNGPVFLYPSHSYVLKGQWSQQESGRFTHVELENSKHQSIAAFGTFLNPETLPLPQEVYLNYFHPRDVVLEGHQPFVSKGRFAGEIIEIGNYAIEKTENLPAFREIMLALLMYALESPSSIRGEFDQKVLNILGRKYVTYADPTSNSMYGLKGFHPTGNTVTADGVTWQPMEWSTAGLIRYVYKLLYLAKDRPASNRNHSYRQIQQAIQILDIKLNPHFSLNVLHRDYYDGENYYVVDGAKKVLTQGKVRLAGKVFLPEDAHLELYFRSSGATINRVPLQPNVDGEATFDFTTENIQSRSTQVKTSHEDLGLRIVLRNGQTLSQIRLFPPDGNLLTFYEGDETLELFHSYEELTNRHFNSVPK
jgi:hypothetical protein